MRRKTPKAKMPEVTLYLFEAEQTIDRPLSRILRDRAAALSFGQGAFAYADTPSDKKPRFVTPRGAYFSVTHTENLFACAIADCEVGLDAQRFCAPDERRARVARRVFSCEEQRALSALSQDEAAREFARLWTLHEASAKFSGAGLKEVVSATVHDLYYTDLTELFCSLGLAAAATLATEKPPRLTVVWLEE